MTVDVVIAFLFVVLVYLGWRSGALSQAIRIVAAITVVLASPFVAEIVRETLFHQSDLARPLIEAGSLFVAGLAIYAGITVCGWLAIRVVRAASKTLSTMDRLGGAAIGALKASVIVYFLLSVFVLLQVPLERVDPEDVLRMRNGRATALVEQYNVLAPWQFPDLGRFHEFMKVGALSEDRANAQIIRQHGTAADLLRREDVKALLEDEALMTAVREDRFARTMADSRVRELLADEKFSRELSDIDWAALRAKLEQPEGAP